MRRSRWSSTCRAGWCATPSELEALGDQDTIDACVDALIKVLADLHAVDPDAVGLGDFGKPSGYLERQVRRWGSQWDLVKCPTTAATPTSGGCTRNWHDAIPPQSRTSIVHGDYRIDNTILDAEDPTRCGAVLDWEMSTLGDPLSDAALMCVYRDPTFDLRARRRRVGLAADPVGRRAGRKVFACRPVRSLDHWEFYMALAYFKLAIIAAGIAYRAREGAGAADTDKVGGGRRRR